MPRLRSGWRRSSPSAIPSPPARGRGARRGRAATAAEADRCRPRARSTEELRRALPAPADPIACRDDARRDAPRGGPPRPSTRSSRPATACCAAPRSSPRSRRTSAARSCAAWSLTRATDNRLKAFFTSGEVRYGEATFQGKGFRSLGQEAIYAAAIRLRRGDAGASTAGWQGDVVAPMIRDLGVTLAMRTDAGDRADGALGPDGQSRPADERQGPPHRRLRVRASSRPRRRSASGALTMAGMAMAFAREGQRPRRAVVHRRGWIVDGRMARGDQPVRRAAAAGDLLRAEQPDGAVDAGARAVGRPRVRRQGRGLRHAGDHDRRHRSGRDRRGVRVGGRARPRGSRADARSSWCRCGCAATRITTTCSISARKRRRRGAIRPSPSRGTPTPSCTPSGRRGIRFRRMRRGCEAEGLIDERRPRGAAARRPRALVEAQAQEVIAAGWPAPELAGDGRAGRRAAARARRGARSRRSAGASISTRPSRPWKTGPPFDKAGSTFLEGMHDGHRRRAPRGSPRVRLRGGRRREVRQRLPAAAAAARGVRRSHSQLDARRGCGARRLRRRRARGPASDRRDAVQRLRRDRLQPAGEQRREDPVPVGRIGADGRADAVGRAPPRRSVPQPEHRGVVLPHSRAQDRGARPRRRMPGR